MSVHPEAHQQRVIDEERELAIKISALDNFISDNPIFKGLPAGDRVLLGLQKKYMIMYQSVLKQRIANFGLPPN